MKPTTKDIISKIADIQIEALSNICKNIQTIPGDLLAEFLDCPPGYEGDKDIMLEETHARLEAYKFMKDYPSMIQSLSEYQLYICSHILFRMEEEWIQDNPEGVSETWNILFKNIDKYHPSLTLLWCHGEK